MKHQVHLPEDHSIPYPVFCPGTKLHAALQGVAFELGELSVKLWPLDLHSPWMAPEKMMGKGLSVIDGRPHSTAFSESTQIPASTSYNTH
jgi:hypothetical protein